MLGTEGVQAVYPVNAGAPPPADPPSIESMLADAAASIWFKTSLQDALKRDPIDAANDADVLARLLHRRAEQELGRVIRNSSR